MSLRLRLVLAAAYVFVVVVIALEVPLAVTIERQRISDFRPSVLGPAALTASTIADGVARISAAATGTKPEPPHPTMSIEQAVRHYAASSGSRVVVVDQQGRVIYDNAGEATPGTLYATSRRPEFGLALAGQVYSAERYSTSLGQQLLIVAVPVIYDGRTVGAVRFTAELGAVEAEVHRTWFRMGLVGLVVIVAGLVMAWFLATSIARPVDRLEEAAVRLGQGDLDARASPEGPGELVTLARSFNRMADALAANIAAQRDFIANASHQLRTPLTGLRLRLEALEAEGGEAGEEARRATAEIDRLATLVQELLLLASASEAGAAGQRVDLAGLAQDAADRWRPQAERAGSAIRLVTGPPAAVWADRRDLEHVLDNLLENAIRYAPPGSEVTIEAGRRDSGGMLVVADSGRGIPEAERERIFERFFRGETGRRTGPGTGLGLAIAAELVRKWGGELRLAEGPGTRFEAMFPRPTLS